MSNPDNSDDTIDSRDVISRIEELEERDEDEDKSDPLDEDEAEELKALKKLADQCERYGDWEHGETLIRDDHFEVYAQQYAEDADLIPKGAGWPARCIDWKQAAEELQVDYMSVDFAGVTYWMRS